MDLQARQASREVAEAGRDAPATETADVGEAVLWAWGAAAAGGFTASSQVVVVRRRGAVLSYSTSTAIVQYQRVKVGVRCPPPDSAHRRGMRDIVGSGRISGSKRVHRFDGLVRPVGAGRWLPTGWRGFSVGLRQFSGAGLDSRTTGGLASNVEGQAVNRLTTGLTRIPLYDRAQRRFLTGGFRQRDRT